MNKKLTKKFELIAKHLPKTHVFSTYKMKISGDDVILSGTDKIDGNQVENDKDYMIDNNFIRDVNHKLRLKKAFRKNGKNGVINYCTGFFEKERHIELIQAINMIL